MTGVRNYRYSHTYRINDKIPSTKYPMNINIKQLTAISALDIFPNVLFPLYPQKAPIGLIINVNNQ